MVFNIFQGTEARLANSSYVRNLFSKLVRNIVKYVCFSIKTIQTAQSPQLTTMTPNSTQSL